MLMSSGNVIFRRIVRNWDDDVTTPTIRRLYDYNMQHSQKEHIKGDYQVQARGSSVLLVREIQAQNLVFIMSQFPDDEDIDIPEVKRAFFRSMLLNSEDFMRSPEERDQWMEEQKLKSGPSEIDLRMAEIEQMKDATEAKVAIAQMESDSRLRVAEMNHQTAMMKLAETMNMNEEQLNTILEKARMDSADKALDRDQKDRQAAVEVADKRRTGEGAGGIV